MSPSKMLRTVIAEAGGLATAADLARRWAVSRQRVSWLASRPDFPAAVCELGGRAVYAIAEADAYHERHGGRAGRPATHEAA